MNMCVTITSGFAKKNESESYNYFWTGQKNKSVSFNYKLLSELVKNEFVSENYIQSRQKNEYVCCNYGVSTCKHPDIDDQQKYNQSLIDDTYEENIHIDGEMVSFGMTCGPSSKVY